MTLHKIIRNQVHTIKRGLIVKGEREAVEAKGNKKNKSKRKKTRKQFYFFQTRENGRLLMRQSRLETDIVLVLKEDGHDPQMSFFHLKD